MTPTLARIKRRVREAVELCGGVDGAGATAGRHRTTAGDWGNRNHRAFPPVDCALALDEVCISLGQGAPILSALAAELDHVCVRLPDGAVQSADLGAALIDASAEFGDIAAEIREATRDHKVCAQDRDRISLQIDEALASLVRLRFVVNSIEKGEG
ncbi:phage regulatory CII family protein [Novosphingobium clariflavum]|uniref:Phage regulatory CII family protein n=1 Tax=Novosphingobium clariflavum TaxID=2029884 RepID=A0ABV6S5Z2_9SPHN|nr:phage regulatory CII family protein [Novosphingobium clariflavum]